MRQPTTVAFVLISILATSPLGTAAQRDPVVHSLVKGESFVYSRVVTYRTVGGVEHEKSTIVLNVLQADDSSASVRQRISIDGGSESVRDIQASPDGRWSYAGHRSVAQDFATWDANQFGAMPARVHPGATWTVDVPRSAMFAAGRAAVKVVAVRDSRVTIEAVGDSGLLERRVPSAGAERYVPLRVRGTWTVRVTYDHGIVQDFHRNERVYSTMNRRAAQTDDKVEVAMRLVSHSI